MTSRFRKIFGLGAVLVLLAGPALAQPYYYGGGGDHDARRAYGWEAPRGYGGWGWHHRERREAFWRAQERHESWWRATHGYGGHDGYRDGGGRWGD